MTWIVRLMVVISLCSCVVPPYYRAYPTSGSTPARRGVPSCRDRGARLLRLYNPGPGAVVVGRTFIPPGWGLMCVPRRVRQMVALQVAGQPPAAVLTRDGRGVLGHSISIVSRDRVSTTAMVDGGSTVLPLAFAAMAARQAPATPAPGGPPPTMRPDAGTAPEAPPASGAVGSAAPTGSTAVSDTSADAGDVGSLWEALQGVESPVDSDAASDPVPR